MSCNNYKWKVTFKNSIPDVQKMSELQDFSDPSVKTLHFQGKDHEFSLWSEDYDTTCPMMCKKFF